MKRILVDFCIVIILYGVSVGCLAQSNVNKKQVEVLKNDFEKKIMKEEVLDNKNKLITTYEISENKAGVIALKSSRLIIKVINDSVTWITNIFVLGR